MSSNTTVDASKSLALTDPGEKNRAEHAWGDRLVIGIGNTVAWLFPILMIAIVTQVVIRANGHNQAWLDDAQWWIYGFAMLTAFGYAITTESHVRVDIFHEQFSVRKKARIEVFALGWLLLPFLGIMIDIMIHYAWASVVAGEGSDSPNGLHRLYLLKASLPILFILAAIAAIAVFTRHFRKLHYPNVWKLLLAMLPFSWFVAERIAHNVLYWYIRLTNPEIAPRRISKEPLMDYSTWIGLALLVVVVLIAYIKRGSPADNAGVQNGVGYNEKSNSGEGI